MVAMVIFFGKVFYIGNNEVLVNCILLTTMARGMLGCRGCSCNKRGDGFNIARDDKLHPRYLGWHRTSRGSELCLRNTTKPSLQTALVPPRWLYQVSMNFRASYDRNNLFCLPWRRDLFVCPFDLRNIFAPKNEEPNQTPLSILLNVFLY